MKLISLQLHNFRQFYGTTPKLSFASGDRNVTVFHGVNGAGKTALLNAFTWALYGDFTRGFKLEEQLANRRALREASDGSYVEVWVELQFKHSQKNYLLRKKARVHKGADGSPEQPVVEEIELQFRDESGELKTEENYAEAIGRILPEDLHTYFFFDGERIERLAQPSSEEQADLSRAAKKLMRIEILERAERDLEKARAELQGELRGVGTSQTDELLRLRASDDSELKKLNFRRDEAMRNIDELKVQKHAVEERLRDVEQVRELQEEREQLVQRDLRLNTEQSSNRAELITEVGKDGYFVFLQQPVNQFRALLDQLRSRGELPAGIKRQFVDDLLDRSTCVCGRPLEPNSEPWKCVHSFRERAGLADVEEAAIRLSGQTDEVAERATAFWERVSRIREKSRQIREERAHIENKLDQIGEQILHAPGEQGPALERRLNEIVEGLRGQEHELYSIGKDIRRKEEEIGEIDSRLEKEETRDARHRIAKRRVSIARETKTLVENMRAVFERKFRHDITEKMKRLFRDVTVVPYTPYISEDYKIQLLDDTTDSLLPVATSQGESQILALCFIASVIEETKEYNKRRDALPGPDSSALPVVMDSPFGSLDPAHRRQVASFLPKVASQVVTMVTETQYRGEVADALQGRIGRAYVMTYNTPRDGVKEVSTSIEGHSYPLVKKSSGDYEFTEIQEVRNA